MFVFRVYVPFWKKVKKEEEMRADENREERKIRVVVGEKVEDQTLRSIAEFGVTIERVSPIRCAVEHRVIGCQPECASQTSMNRR